MKKKYEKPGLYIENFALSQSIAADCNIERNDPGTLGFPTQGDSTLCGWDLIGVVIWSTTEKCNDIHEADEQVFGFCYNNPSGGTPIFNYS